MQGRILVVDDLPDVRSTISGVLKDAGYLTRSAGSRAEALAILQKERFHVAVLDVRLDESDEENQEGMDLLHDINQHDDSMAVIILTGYANVDIVMKALQPVRGKQPAYRFLRKNEIMSLTEIIPGAFHEALRLNLGLAIDDPGACLDQLIRRIRFSGDTAPDIMDIAEEVREIFGRLFFECEIIHLDHMQQGFSGAAVFQVTPVYQGKGMGENVVVKVGNKEEISAEIANYEKYVKGIVGGHRIPKALVSASTRHISGIQYSFAGLGGRTEHFAGFFQSAPLENILAALDNLYLDTLFPQKQKTGQFKPACDLREFYLRHLHLNEAKLRKAAARTIGAGLAFLEEPDGKLQSDGDILLNPMQAVQEADFHADSFFTTIHGDLNGQNILLDQHRDTWLIDFLTTTDDGHILQDYAALETYIRFKLVDVTEIDMLRGWDRCCFDGNPADASLPAELQLPALVKAHQAILHIRELAVQTPFYSDRAYLTALFFNTLRKLTFSETPLEVQNHALHSAALIAARLEADNAVRPPFRPPGSNPLR